MGTSQYIGSIDGKFTVDANGGASFSIPIHVPPGTGGMAPSLSVVYNSAAPNDLLGVGWGMQGLSTISRTGATYAQDDLRSAVNYGPNDRLVLDGQRLVVVEGTYGNEGSLYRTEIESWSKIVPVFNSNNPNQSGPDAFMVYTKDGKCYEYGNTEDSKVRASLDNPSIRVWALSKVTDLNGNYLTITYQVDTENNVNYPLQIDYTGNSNTTTPLTTQRSVRFEYENRSDAVPCYEGGYAFTYKKRLKSIQTYLDTQLVMEYEFAYKSGQATGRSQLISITQSDANGIALPPTVFAWQDSSSQIFQTATTLPVTGLTWQGTFLPLDVNGDGHTDLINAYEDSNNLLQMNLFLANPDGSGFSKPIPLPSSGLPYGGTLYPMDVNGDGCMDLVYAVKTNGGDLGITVFLATNTKGQWTLKPGTINGAGPDSIPYGGQLVPMDVTGNGLIDLVYCFSNDDQLNLYVWQSNGETFGSAADAPQQTSLEYGGQFLAMDFDGDGMTDLLYAYEDEQQHLAIAWLQSDGTSLPVQSTNLMPPSANLFFGGTLLSIDVNADGKGDIVYCIDNGGNLELVTLLSTGVNFVLLQKLNTGLPAGGELLPMDCTGDGLGDILVASATGSGIKLQAFLSTGSGYTLNKETFQSLSNMTWGGNFLPLDMNGTGKTDLLYASEDGNEQMVLTTSPATVPFPDLITSITNGWGGRIEIVYKPLTDPAVYDKGTETTAAQIDPQSIFNNSITGATFSVAQGGQVTQGMTYATRSTTFPKYVVSSYVKNDNRHGRYEYDYHYSGAMVDLSGRGWLGFATVEMWDRDVKTKSITQYHQQFPLTQHPRVSAVQQTSDEILMSEVLYTYDSIPSALPCPKVYQERVTAVEKRYYTNGTLDNTENKSYRYDEFGNAKFSSNVNDSTNHLPVFVFKWFHNDTKNWRIGYQTEEKMTFDRAETHVLKWEKIQYDTTTQNVLERQQWDDQNQTWLASQYQYDVFGNRTWTKDHSGAVSTTKYETTYHAFVLQKTSAPNQAGQTLTTSFEYDPKFGVLTSKTDANGVMTLHTIDGLGGITQVQGANPKNETVVLIKYSRGQDPRGFFYKQTEKLLDWEEQYWSVTKTYLDGLARTYRTSTTSADGTNWVIVDKVLDSQNRILQETLPYLEGSTPVSKHYTYDSYGRLVKTVSPIDGGGTITTRNSYPQITTRVCTEDVGTTKRVTTFVSGIFHSAHKVVKRTDADQGVTSFTYDALGRLTGSVDPMGVTNSFTYDSLGRKLTTTVQFDTQTITESYSYDDIKRKVTIVDGNQVQSVLIFDALRRLVSKQVGSQSPMTVTYDSPAQTYSMGRMSQVVDSDGTTYVFGYDPHGNQGTISVTLNGTPYEFQKTYMPTNKVQQLTYPDGSVLQNQYTSGGVLAGTILTDAMSTNDPITVAAYEQFTAFGLPQTICYGNQTKETLDFNNLGQLQSQCLTNQNGTDLIDVLYQWNAYSELQSITDNLTLAMNQTFEYDAVGRVQQASGVYSTQNYTYNPAGNRLSLNDTQYTYTGHQLTSSSGTDVATFTYDAVGNLTTAVTDQTYQYKYDERNRLIEVSVSSGQTLGNYAYDYTGRRIVKSVTNGPITYYVSPFYEVTVFPDGSTQHTKYVQGLKGFIASVTTVDPGNGSSGTYKGVPVEGIYYYHKNQINSTILQTDDQGNTVATVGYLPYGEYSLTGLDFFRHKFTGQEFDAETGLYYFNARYYNPHTGRFLTADTQLGGPMQKHDVFNRYAYVLNNPVNFRDPTGHSIWSDLGDFFTSTVVEDVDSVAVDTALTIAGAALDVAGQGVLGSTLTGAGINGFVYSFSHLDGGFSYKDYGENLLEGAVGGLISGGVASMASSLVERGFDSLITNAVAGVVGNTASSVASTVLTNAFTGNALNYGLGASALEGAVTGGISSWASGMAEREFASAKSVLRGAFRSGDLDPEANWVVDNYVWNRYAFKLLDDSSSFMGGYILGMIQPRW